ncbi:MAG TPA: flagellar hook-basal body complex protein FliE [Candidatus Sulfotelmatobacter sp.]|nr:flagellar hook-basal body complex protein FliE [Candidatus Sulfotelmatobacter sp.]
MAQRSIDPVSAADLRLSQLLGQDDLLAQTVPGMVAAAPADVPATASATGTQFTGSPFEDILSKAVESLNGVSRSEMYANQLIDSYLRGQAELQDVMAAQAKMSVMMQLAVTSVNTAVTTFQQITQMQI